ncbi:hypothetical protein N8Z24_00830 [bacterium]|nr:hypothetical protein [bacterium]
MSSDFDILSNLQKELSGDFLQKEVEVRGHKYVLRLLTEQENSWTFRFFKSGNELSLAVAVRSAQLAVGIRSIDGTPLIDCVKKKLDALTEPERNALFLRNENSEHLVAAELFVEFLTSQSPSFIGELHDVWAKLQKEHGEAQVALKKLSGEDSETEEKKVSTESSPAGDQ